MVSETDDRPEHSRPFRYDVNQIYWPRSIVEAG